MLQCDYTDNLDEKNVFFLRVLFFWRLYQTNITHTVATLLCVLDPMGLPNLGCKNSDCSRCQTVLNYIDFCNCSRGNYLFNFRNIYF